jgi:hypothetical protein
MMPRSRRPGIAATVVAKLTARSGSIPLFDASPLTFTCMQTSSGGMPAVRVADSRVAIFARSRVSTQSNDDAGKRSLVALQRADQVPTNVDEITQARHLRCTLLHVVFAEIPLPERVNGPDRSGRKRLADREKPHAVGFASGCFGRTGDSHAPRLATPSRTGT